MLRTCNPNLYCPLVLRINKDSPFCLRSRKLIESVCVCELSHFSVAHWIDFGKFIDVIQKQTIDRAHTHLSHENQWNEKWAKKTKQKQKKKRQWVHVMCLNRIWIPWHKIIETKYFIMNRKIAHARVRMCVCRWILHSFAWHCSFHLCRSACENSRPVRVW